MRIHIIDSLSISIMISRLKIGIIKVEEPMFGAWRFRHSFHESYPMDSQSLIKNILSRQIWFSTLYNIIESSYFQRMRSHYAITYLIHKLSFLLCLSYDHTNNHVTNQNFKRTTWISPISISFRFSFVLHFPYLDFPMFSLLILYTYYC